MDEPIQSWDSSTTNHSRLLTKPQGASSSGLTLVLPSLKSLKNANKAATSKKGKHRADSAQPSGSLDVEVQEKKAPRPLKLKPLKEVLSKLIYQIKKKDDYAFFLSPVNPSQVPGYADIIKQPMDLGTMTIKVEKGKYRSLEEFANDFKLVTTNAKTFNPPGSIYYTEAERIEAWGMDHITKAAPTVIQYETDWKIDIEKDDDVNINVDEEEEQGQQLMDVDMGQGRRRSTSVASQTQQHHTGRRGPRGPYKRHGATGGSQMLETLDADGGLPGSKDGLGAFPPGSDWAKTMLTLKLKGKRYRTKKERLRFEKEGPPYLPEGSLDYTEMEDPFSVLSSFVPDPVTRPYLTPLYPPPPPPTGPSTSTYPPTPISTQTHTFYTQQVSTPTSAVQSPVIPSQTPLSAYPPQTPFSVSAYPTPTPEPTVPPHPASSVNAVTLPLSHVIPEVGQIPEIPNTKRRHWTITRNTVSRLKGKDRDDEVEADGPVVGAREAGVLDWGSMAVLAGELAEEMKRRGLSAEDSESQVELVRESLVVDKEKGKAREEMTTEYWTKERALEAEEYIRDVVYGGVDGFAYVRSLAEFVCPRPGEEYDPRREYSAHSLGMPLAKWVEKNIVDPLTEGRHAVLRDAAITFSQLISSSSPSSSPIKQEHTDSPLIQQIIKSLHVYPAATIALSVLMQIETHKIDMAALIKSPEELFVSEEEWAGKGLKGRGKLKREEDVKGHGEVKVEEIEGGGVIPVTAAPNAAAATALFGREPQAVAPYVSPQPQPQSVSSMDTKTSLAQEEEEEEDDDEKERTAMEAEEPNKTWMDVNASTQSTASGAEYELEGPEELSEVLDYVAGVIAELDRRIRRSGRVEAEEDVTMADASQPTLDAQAVNEPSYVNGTDHPSEPQSTSAKPVPTSVEDPTLRNLRLNLLALAKRAPLDTIARLPEDLVPEHIRNYVPTLGSSSSNSKSS